MNKSKIPQPCMVVWGVVCWLLAFACVAEQASEQYAFDDPQQRVLFNQLAAELRCPKCQNQNIADSDALIATDLKRKLYQLVKQGQDREQILQYMKQRYGDFVHYQPPVTPLTMWMWLLPVLFVLLAGGLLWRNSQVSRKETPQLDSVKLAQADALLAGDESVVTADTRQESRHE